MLETDSDPVAEAVPRQAIPRREGSLEGPPGSARTLLGLPKGRMQAGVLRLLADAGVHLETTHRAYRPTLSLGGFEVKVLKPQNVVEMLDLGRRQVGFAGADWVAELDADLVELLDTGLDPVRLVAAAPAGLAPDGCWPRRRLVIASEYERLTRDWIARRELDAVFVRSYGATEAFPPEDADVILDNTATGATLAANGLLEVEQVAHSSTRLYAHPAALEDPLHRRRIEDLTLLLRSVLEGRRRVMLELNVRAEDLESVVAALPCMREPTVSPLVHEGGFAVRAAVPRDELPLLIPVLKARGGADLVVTSPAQIVP